VKLVHFLVALPLALVLIDFAWSNKDPVSLGLYPFVEGERLPLGAVVPIALGIGFCAGELVAWINGGRWRREARRRARRIEALERELAQTQAQLPSAPGLPTPRRPRD